MEENARKWKFAHFFNGVKAAVRKHWKPAQAHRLADPDGKIYGTDDRYTLLQVRVRADGSVAGLKVERASGVAFLDQMAIQAFLDAQPFGTPPARLIDADGVVKFRFGFCFEIGGAAAAGARDGGVPEVGFTMATVAQTAG